MVRSKTEYFVDLVRGIRAIPHILDGFISSHSVFRLPLHTPRKLFHESQLKAILLTQHERHLHLSSAVFTEKPLEYRTKGRSGKKNLVMERQKVMMSLQLEVWIIPLYGKGTPPL